MFKIKNRLQLFLIPLMISAITALFCGLKLFSDTKHHLLRQHMQYIPTPKYYFLTSVSPEGKVFSVSKESENDRSNLTQKFNSDEKTKLLQKDLNMLAMNSK